MNNNVINTKIIKILNNNNIIKSSLKKLIMDDDSENDLELDIKSDTESESFEDTKEETFKNYLEKDNSKQIYDNGNRIIYKCLIKHIILALNNDEIIFSENNRMVDNNRLKEFINFESLKCDPIILGERLDKNSKFDIIDGQHRLTFLKNINLLQLSDSYVDKILNNYIPLDVRICRDENDFKKYIDSTNNRKNFSSDQLRIFKYPILRDLLNKEFKMNIFTIPLIKINEDYFKTQLFKTKYFEDFNNTSEMICEKIKKINIFFKNMTDLSKLSPDRDISKKSYIKTYEKAKKTNIFLAFNKEENFYWMILLDYNEENWNNTWDILFMNRKKK